MNRFTSGSVVFRMWKDGSGEVLALFQYFSQACDWAKEQSMAEKNSGGLYYIAVCDAELKFKAYPTLGDQS